MLKWFRRNAKGFTLIELLIVVAIIGILAAIAIPNLLSAQKRSKISRAAADTKQIVTQTQLYINDNNCVPRAITDLWDGNGPTGGGTCGEGTVNVYMAQVKDPFKPASDYEWAAPGVTNDIMALSVGPDGTRQSTLPTASANGSWCSGCDDVGYDAVAGAYGS